MLQYDAYQLDNGLQVILNQDFTTPMVAINILYDVGAKDENPEQTGLAHLFEHVMFSGSKNAPDYDKILQKAGADNNAFTNNDVTNYYVTIPKENLELGIWIEADRMQGLNLTQESLDVQKKVVIEEFKQRYFNQPYGDVWLGLRPLCYKEHPYQWPTIGKSIEQIETVNLQDAENFYRENYCPSKGTLVISGNFEADNCKALIEKYFGPRIRHSESRKQFPAEPQQTERREKTLQADVPSDVIYLAFLVPEKQSRLFQVADLLTDVLAGSSGRLYYALVKENKIFSEINAYLTGETEGGLLLITGKLNEGVDFTSAEENLWNELNLLINEGLKTDELKQVVNKKLTAEVYSEMQILSKAMKLAFYSNLGMLDEVNNSSALIESVTDEDIVQFAKDTFKPEKVNVLKYARSND